MNKIVACVLVLLLACPQIWGAPGPNEKHVEKIKKRVAKCVEKPRRVSIETYDGRRLQGSISEADADTFIITNGSRSSTLAYADVKNIKWPSSTAHYVMDIAGAAAVTGAIFGLVYLLGGLKG